MNVNKKIWQYLDDCESRGLNLCALQGARRAGKTYTTCQWLLLKMLMKGDVVIFASMTAEQGRKGAYEDCKSILNSAPELSVFFDVLKSPREIHCKTTIEGKQGIAYFSSFQDPETAKGAACDWVFINEANKFTKQQYLDLAANARKGVIVDYNPNTHFWIEEIIDEKDVLLCSWKDNAKHLTHAQLAWFQQIYDAAHRDGATAADYYYYLVYYEGQYAEVSGSIFTRANIDVITPEQVPSKLFTPCLFGDPSALRGADYFPLVLSAKDENGDIYILDVDSTNEGSREDRVKTILRMGAEYDDTRFYLETNGLVGIEFYEFLRASEIPVFGWCSRGNKFERIISRYQEITNKTHFVESAQMNVFLQQVYAFDKKCEHDDNIDAVCSSVMLQGMLH